MIARAEVVARLHEVDRSLAEVIDQIPEVRHHEACDALKEELRRLRGVTYRYLIGNNDGGKV